MVSFAWAFHRRKTLLCLVAVLVLCFPPIVSATDVRAVLEPATRLTEGEPFSPYAMPTDFTVRPSIFRTPNPARCKGITVDQPAILRLVAACVDARGQIIPNCDVRLTLGAIPLSGGHDHDDPSRPTGTFTPAAGNTGPGGILPVQYTAAEVSGIIEATLTGADAQGRPVTPAIATIGVRTGGLQPLPRVGAGFRVNSSRFHDFNNLFTTPTVNTKLQQLPGKFLNELVLNQAVLPSSVPTLVYTSMSLPEGGLFDIDRTWSPPHCSHRFGRDVDLDIESSIPDGFRRELSKVILNSGFFFPVVAESPANPATKHWHLTSRN